MFDTRAMRPFRPSSVAALVPHARQPSSVDSSTGAHVTEAPVVIFTNTAPATSPDIAHEIVAQGNQPAGIPSHQQSPWAPVHSDRLESALARHPDRAFVNSLMQDLCHSAVVGYTILRLHYTPAIALTLLLPI